MFESECVERPYKGYVIRGRADAVDNYSDQWFAVGHVLLYPPHNSVLWAEAVKDPLLEYSDPSLATWFGLGLAEIAVDHWVPPPAYHLTPMNAGWAVDLLPRGAAECVEREIRKPKLYEALDYLEERLDSKAWLVRRYRRELRRHRRTFREKRQLREILRVTTRGIQIACADLLVSRMNELAAEFRSNRAKIQNLQRVLNVVRQGLPYKVRTGGF